MGLTALGSAAVRAISQAATGSLVAALWQGTVLAVAAWLGLRLLPKTPAAVRFAIWFAVFLVVAGLPVVSLLSHAAGAARENGRGAWLTIDARDARWCLAIAAVWAAASLVRAATLVAAALRVRALWKRATPVQFAGGFDPTHRDTAAMDGARGVLNGAPRLLSVARRAQICTSDEMDRPSVIGFLSPKILIPRWLLDQLSDAELEQIVLHEAGHLGRADDWMNLLQKIALVVFPLNPALAWVERRLCFERELACDERVLRVTGAPKAYASCLAALAEHRLGRRGMALSLGALGRESELGRRVRRILGRGERMRPAHARLVLGGAMLGLLGGAVELARCPQLVGFSSVRTQDAKVVAPAVGHAAGMGYEAVVFRPDPMVETHRYHEDNLLQRKIDVPHRTSLKASMDRAVQGNAAGDLDLSGPSGRRAERGPAGQVQWVVVTSWEGMDGARLVLTTASASAPAANPEAAEMQPEGSQQVHRYAAVPVRGGWLVFQL